MMRSQLMHVVCGNRPATLPFLSIVLHGNGCVAKKCVNNCSHTDGR
ncbi:hypothetical protein C7382_10242 [Porphyromonas loveana]|uniref:Uncharacterized protein n=1 Tax=Porphyromonas loveana TaxID=1884669 RepID=A0A2U1FPK6_9PORP|nr:hypothetical protein C7382_10242 [Porphyromonas loveana]